ncbi:ADP-ribosyl cyclase/cyclic ADP-ribose hydrolase 1-like isoform X1 [Xyrichtys novacula]|uniref:ADP-ribosyl cyclase/cyclic ADP-ribose hydrolase n=1 Tax=Xyrichtys novacula TaxID=13765 RepID=A0AAV1HEB5_XYRNO|nr:ADP-ribosyl cyclase/cyclic ADP-ribose hydrolase 1-like isoform X1 [Xyrichtys novacula]
MASKKALPISGTMTVMVIVVVLVPSALLLDQTVEFKKTFMKKCKEFPEEEAICEAKFEIFVRAYVGKKETDVTEDSYNELFDNTPFKHPCEKTMFWSGTHDLATRFTKKRDDFFSVGDTLLGHVLDGLYWCGKEGTKGTFINDCVGDDPNPVLSFWVKMSVKFAEYTCDDTYVMLDGETEQPFFPGTAFEEDEIPYLKSSTVKSLTVILVVNEKTGTKCNNESLKNLNNIMKGKNIGYACKEVTKAHIEKCIKEGKGNIFE